jgi:predicted RNase H-like HicB family nuclease
MSGPLTVSWTIAYDAVEDGWIMARVVEKPGAMSQGRTREEARENVRDALRELLIYESSEPAETGAGDFEPLEVKIGP